MINDENRYNELQLLPECVFMLLLLHIDRNSAFRYKMSQVIINRIMEICSLGLQCIERLSMTMMTAYITEDVQEEDQDTHTYIHTYIHT